MEHHEAVRTMAAERYLLDEMTEGERHEFETHYFECSACAESVRSGALLADGVRAAAQAVEGQPHAGDAVLPFPASGRTTGASPFSLFVPMAAAAMLALVVGYQTFVTIPGLRSRLDAPRVLTPIAVAPVSRGEGTVVPLDRAERAVVLALDINIDPPVPSHLVYDLRTDAGVVVLSGQGPVPPQGTPLLLELPGNSLTSGQYSVVVRDSAAPNREAGIYHFVVR